MLQSDTTHSPHLKTPNLAQVQSVKSFDLPTYPKEYGEMGVRSKTNSQYKFKQLSSNQTKTPAVRTSSDHTYLSADGARVSFVTAK